MSATCGGADWIGNTCTTRLRGCAGWYPDRRETEILLRETGITALARKLGVKVTAADVDWSRGGMRGLESILTRLTLEDYRRRSQLVPRPVTAPRTDRPEIVRQLES